MQTTITSFFRDSVLGGGSGGGTSSSLSESLAWLIIVIIVVEFELVIVSKPKVHTLTYLGNRSFIVRNGVYQTQLLCSLAKEWSQIVKGVELLILVQVTSMIGR